MSTQISRRSFLRNTAIAGGVSILTGGVFKARAYAANEKLNTALIGVGGRGGAFHEAVSSENFVAMCDVDTSRMADLANSNPKTKTYQDYRRMLDVHRNLDAVFVITPDHHHFPAAMRAIANGAGVYVEKPLCHSIWETRTLTDAAREAKVPTQMGHQGHSTDSTRRLCEYIWAGSIGEVTEVHCYSDRPLWPQGIKRPTETLEIPSSLDWDVWMGPAPKRPYHANLHPFDWRGWWDFGTGALGDMGCHIMDSAFWALKLGSPSSVEAKFDESFDETGPNWSIVTYEFPARDNLPPCRLVWYDGGKMPERPAELEEGRNLDTNGAIFYGDKGTLISGTPWVDGGVSIIPEEKRLATPPPWRTLPRVTGGHTGDFLRSCRGGEHSSANFNYSGPFTEFVLLGNLAIRLGKKIEWDGENMRATNAPEAEDFIRRTYRPGWMIG
ncbi:MAG: Gfo/Idh/MocA family oxidoreductase [Opitutales bacterium]